MKRSLIFLNLILMSICLLLPGQVLSMEDWFKKGLSFLESKRYEEAIEAFNKVLEKDPRYADAYNNRGVAWYHKGDYGRATADYDMALSMNPNHADAYNNRGVIWSRKEDYDRAIADCTKALELNPRYADAYNNRGEALFHQGHYERAIADCTKALDIDPRHDKAYNQLAWILAVCPDGRYRDGAKAIDLAINAVQLNPDPDFYDTLAAAYAEAGRFENAITTQEKVINLLKEEGRTEKLAAYTERLNAYKDKKPWRLKKTVYLRPYPYTIQVSSDRNEESSHRIAMKLRNQGDPAFTSYAQIPGKGDWYRVLIGFYETLKEAQKAALALKKEKFPAAFVANLPYAIQVGLYDEDQKLTKLEADLQKKGHMTYSISDQKESGKVRLLVGAFKTDREASTVSKRLKGEGFEAKVVFR